MSTWTRSPDFALREVGDHTMLVPTQGAPPPGVMLFLLDGPVALRLWQELAHPRTVEDLAQVVIDEFDVERDAARADVQTFLDQLQAAGCAREDT